jgi:hypothetical protein
MGRRAGVKPLVWGCLPDTVTVLALQAVASPTGPSGSPPGKPQEGGQRMQQPVEVQVDEHEQIVERVAAVDVAKARGMVCLRIPRGTIPGRQVR